MSALFIVYLLFSLTATWLLLSAPYLRITSLGWFIAIWSLPYAGALFFFLTVVRHRVTGHTEHYHELAQYAAPIEDGDNHVMSNVQRINNLGKNHGFLPYFLMTLDKTEILIDQQFIDALYKTIDQAQKRIWITTYIFSGAVKTTLIEKLIAAHARGVDVKLLVDRIGSGLVIPFSANKKTFDRLPFDTKVFHQKLRYSLLFIEKRLHSKIVIVDDAAFIGSHNLRDEVLPSHQAFASNVSLYFTGSVVKQLEAVFADLWLTVSGEEVSTNNTAAELQNKAAIDADKILSAAKQQKNAFARISFSEPMVGSLQYNRYFTSLFFAARKRILIWMPYVIPTQSMRSALIAASKVGLEVKVLMPAKTDSLLVDNAHQLVLRELADSGVECAVSPKPFDHSKIIIIDDVAIIGSTNLDHRSLFRNYECNIEVCDQGFCDSVVSLFEDKYREAEPVKQLTVCGTRNRFNQLSSLIASLY